MAACPKRHGIADSNAEHAEHTAYLSFPAQEGNPALYPLDPPVKPEDDKKRNDDKEKTPCPLRAVY